MRPRGSLSCQRRSCWDGQLAAAACRPLSGWPLSHMLQVQLRRTSMVTRKKAKQPVLVQLCRLVSRRLRHAAELPFWSWLFNGVHLAQASFLMHADGNTMLYRRVHGMAFLWPITLLHTKQVKQTGLHC